MLATHPAQPTLAAVNPARGTCPTRWKKIWRRCYSQGTSLPVLQEMESWTTLGNCDHLPIPRWCSL